MNEIHVAPVLDAVVQGALSVHHLQLVPADLRNFQTKIVRESYNFPAKNVQALRATVELLTPFKQRLVADANV